MKLFPIMGSPCIKIIPWDLISTHEKQALANHGQDLERLAQRGGLSACEVMAVLEKRAYTRMPLGVAEKQLIARVEKFHKENPQ